MSGVERPLVQLNEGADRPMSMMTAPDSFRAGTAADASIVLALGGLIGVAGHPHLARLQDVRATSPREPIADAVHFLCLLHGSRPSLIEDVASRHGGRNEWLLHAAAAFTDERLFLAKLAVSVGPMPSSAGQLAAEQAVSRQRQALLTLARSERGGCALGACCALLIDWAAIRPLLDAIAERVGAEPRASSLPAANAARVEAELLDQDPRTSRAAQFAAQQVFSQHRALFDLLEARDSIRR